MLAILQILSHAILTNCVMEDQNLYFTDGQIGWGRGDGTCLSKVSKLSGEATTGSQVLIPSMHHNGKNRKKS